MPDSNQRPKKIPSGPIRSPKLTWLFNITIGLYGFWEILHPSKSSLGSSAGVGAIALAIYFTSLPMILVHELGHLITGRLLGLSILEFCIGVGPVVWQGRWLGIRLVLKTWPIAGHVMHLNQIKQGKLTRAIFVAGGPAANALTAWLMMRLSGLEITRLFSPPTLTGVAVAANLWLVISTLCPIKNNDARSFSNGSDGWVLWRLLRGKPETLTDDEVLAQRGPSGLVWLKAQATRTRWVLLVLVFACISIVTSTRPDLIHKYSVPQALQTTFAEAPFLGIILFLVFLGVWVSRCSWTIFVRTADRIEASPLKHHVLAYSRLLKAQADNWHQNEVPPEKMLVLAESLGDPTKISVVEEALRDYPQVRLLQLFYFESLLAVHRYHEAQTQIETFLQHDDLPSLLRTHLESLPLATHLASIPDKQIILSCDASIDALTNEGEKMQRLQTFASILIDEPSASMLGLAERWCLQAQELYPFDPEIHLQLGAIYTEMLDFQNAHTWLKMALTETSGGNRSSTVSAWLALLAAKEKTRDARSKLRESLKQNLPFQLRQRLEKAFDATADTLA